MRRTDACMDVKKCEERIVTISEKSLVNSDWLKIVLSLVAVELPLLSR
jgi:hypothetical protein